jgi:hypothetical protein
MSAGVTETDSTKSIVTRYFLIDGGAVTESRKAPARAGAVVLWVTTSRSLDVYYAYGPQGEPISSPLDIDVNQGALTINLKTNRETIRVYGPGWWREVQNPNVERDETD